MQIAKELPAIVAQVGSGVLLLSSIICLALKRTAFNLYMDNIKSLVLLSYPQYGSEGWLDIYPKHLLAVTQGPVVAATSFGIVTGFAVLVAIVGSKKKQQSLKIKPIPKVMALAVMVVTALLGTIAMIYEFARYGGSSHFDPEHTVSASVYYDKGSFTLERWTCETPKFIKIYELEEFKMQCAGEKGSRALLVFVWLSSLATVGGLVWDWRSTHFVVERKIKRNEEGIYY